METVKKNIAARVKTLRRRIRDVFQSFTHKVERNDKDVIISCVENDRPVSMDIFFFVERLGYRRLFAGGPRIDASGGEKAIGEVKFTLYSVEAGANITIAALYIRMYSSVS